MSRLFEAITDADIPSAIVEHIKDLMREGKLAPGDQLPGERQLMVELNVGRSSLREGLQALQATGFVRVIPGKGTFVQEPHPRLNLESMMWASQNGGKKALSELFQVRNMLECEAASLAAESADLEAIATIRQAFEQLVAAVAQQDVDKMASADVEFHRAIVMATHNDLMVTLLDSIAVPLHKHRLLAFHLSGGHSQTIPNHKAILLAIEDRDPKGARWAMKHHLDVSRDHVLKDIATFGAEPLDSSVGDGALNGG